MKIASELKMDFVKPENLIQIIDPSVFEIGGQETIKSAFEWAKSAEMLDKRTVLLVQLLFEMRSDPDLISAGFLVKYWRSLKNQPEALQKLKLALEALNPSILGILKALDGLALIDHLHEKEQSDLEQLRKMLLAMASDMRAVILKLALQTVLMRTLHDIDIAKQQNLALQTRDIFAPLANRLGIAQLKSELEDRALRILEPDIYQEITRELEEKRSDRERYIERIIHLLRYELEKNNIQINKLYGRVKHINSIYQKMKRKGIRFDQLNDVRAVRIETETVEECYKALAIVDSLWTSIPSEFDDYIHHPKANGYQSLHSSFIAEGRVLEVQIRTTKMHEHAELGVAAHWRYKEKGIKHSEQFEQQIEWLRRMIKGGDHNRGDVVFDQFKNEAFKDQVYAVSPQGKVIDLPEGATPLDFAYHIHTNLGHQCNGARINGLLVPLTTPLKNGDTVEILTQKDGTPSRDWLNDHLGYLQSGRAKAKVRSYFKKLEKDSSVQAGREMLEREAKRLSLEIDDSDLEGLTKKFTQNTVADLLAVIGYGDLGVLTVIHEIANQRQAKAERDKPKTLTERLAQIPIKRAPARTPKGNITVEGIDDIIVNFATCCQPVPPTAISGFITLGRGVNIHRADCPNIAHLGKAHPERIVQVNWNGQEQGIFSVAIGLDIYDRHHVLRDISSVINDERIPILEVNFHEVGKNTNKLTGFIRLEIRDMGQLAKVLHLLGQIKDVENVRRLQT